MDRLTPFAAAELDWTWCDLWRDRARGQVRLALLLVPRTASAGVLAALRAAGAQPALLEGEEGTVPLDRASQSRARRRSRALAAGAAACGLLALVAAGLPFLRQSTDLRRVERRIQALRPDVDRVDALRRRIAGSVAGADVLAAQRAATGEVLAALALVTEILPDDTYLSEFGWRSRTLTLSGQSAAAARLIGALSASPTVRNPTFAAPVIRDEAARADRFSIRAEIAAEATP
jgi:general secretion pathway protein L